jgi:uncharacterized protein
MESKSNLLKVREFLIVAFPAILLVAGAFWLALQFVQPAPSMKIVMGTSRTTSPYYRIAERYQKFLAGRGITLELRQTAASAENLKLLKDDSSGVQAAFLQGGITNSRETPRILSLGRVLNEPIWIFHNNAQTIGQISDLKGKRVLVGPAGGGTNMLAMRLLAANDVTPATATLINMELPDYGAALSGGQADAGFLVIGADTPTVQKLFETPNISLLNLTQANAYSQRFPYLKRLELERGIVDFGKNIPPASTSMVGTTAAVVVREDLHPALVNMLAQALAAVHAEPVLNEKGEAPLFQATGEFPMASDAEFPMSSEAHRVYHSGAPFLQRYLPFWLATLIDRTKVMVLPLIGILLPVLKLAPMLYNWRVRRRLLHWYRELKKVEADLNAATAPEQVARKRERVEEIEAAVNQIPVPLGYSNQVFDLRQHVDVVRRRLAAAARGTAAP